jgi:hypothetical protein
MLERGERQPTIAVSGRIAGALRCRMEANALTIEKKLDEVIETNQMLLKLFEERGFDVGGGSKDH